MSDLTHDLIDIAVGHLLPKPKKYAWVSAVESGPYHIETNDSAANGGQGFKAICGAAGDFNFHLTGSQIFPSQKCKTCVESSTGNILDVSESGEIPFDSGLGSGSALQAGDASSSLAPTASVVGWANGKPPAVSLDVADRATGNAPVTDGLQVGDEGVGGTVDGHGLPSECALCASALLSKLAPETAWEKKDALLSEYQASPADSQFPTDDRYADNVSRFVDSVELAEQYRAEEEAAAEEGALIEASGYQDPGSDPRFA